MRRWMNEMPALLRRFAARWKTYLALHLAVALLIIYIGVNTRRNGRDGGKHVSA